MKKIIYIYLCFDYYYYSRRKHINQKIFFFKLYLIRDFQEKLYYLFENIYRTDDFKILSFML